MRTKIFNFLAKLATKHPKKVIAAALTLTLAAAVYSAFTIRLNANLDDLVSMKLDYHRRYIEFLKEFGDEEYLYVVVDASKNLPRAKKYVEALGAKLKGIPDLKQVIWKIENPALERSFLLYLTPSELKSLKAMTVEGPFAVKNIASWHSFAPLFGALANRISGPVSADDEAELTTGFKFIDGLLDDMSASLERDVPYQSRIQQLFFGNEKTFDPDGFLKNGELLFILIMPSKDFSTMEVIKGPMDAVRGAIASVKENFPDIDAGLTGRPVLSADEMLTSNRDMTRATVIALIIEAVLLLLFFRNAARPAATMFALVMGIAWTFGLVAVIYGTLNILSIVFAIILVSTAIEYGIQIVARYQEELAHSKNVATAVQRSLTLTGPAVVTSALTTAAAFCTIMWTDFSALVQLGLIAAAGIILCLVAMLVVLPAMLVLLDFRKTAATLADVHPFVMPKIERIYSWPRALFAVSMTAIAVIAIFAGRTTFDNNLLNLQAKGLDSVKYEEMIIEKSGETTWFARAVAGSMGESRARAEKFRTLSSVRGVDDVERLLPPEQKEKMAIVRTMAPVFEGVRFSDVDGQTNERMLMFELWRLASNLEGLEEEAFKGGRADAVEELSKFAGKVRTLVEKIGGADKNGLARMGQFQRAFFADLRKNMEILAGGLEPQAITLKDLPADMVGRFMSPKGNYALFIYPKENIWDPQALEKFVTDIRSVDDSVVGTPIEVYESGRLMRETFKKSAVLAVIVICLLVWLDFRNWRCVVLSVFPLVVGTLMLLGIMGIFGISFNMANFFAIPILVGIGVDFGVNVVHRLRQEEGFRAIGRSMGKGILLTALANAVGFGTMIFAHHRGLASLGLVMSIGCLLCFVASVIVMPPLAKWLNWGHRPRKE